MSPPVAELKKAYWQGGIYKATEYWYKHAYPVIDRFIVEQILTVAAAHSKPVTCQKSCDSCCHEQVLAQGLEGFIVAAWINKQPRQFRKQISKKLISGTKK